MAKGGNGHDRGRRGHGSPFVTDDPWEGLREFTDARIGMGRSGVSLPLREWLRFNLDHALAKDAVMLPFESDNVAHGLREKGIKVVQLDSQAKDKDHYLARPDLGRRLSPGSKAALDEAVKGDPAAWLDKDVLVVICDGLSALAIHTSAVALTTRFLALLKEHAISPAPVAVVTRGRVAVADEVNDHAKARLVVNLVGERPGLSSPDSMGAYITYGAYRGIMEESRNCISNIRPAGLSLDDALRKLAYIVQKALALRITGTSLKDDMPDNYLPFELSAGFLEGG
ncbi:MAG: ethanolamine ammonia-lyase subunit EutC [Deltaproteobacteria bacterium]|jgi:ethanolamine ammonia-lyase small subunit|nr:ethanolamine ammonia-lyase subunit EutC [Deltaproteobacteria bacterium]